ncbi:radical SAM protein [Streptomyces broussonetiae]|uniref:Radical SAM protein n=1 Tax=Streptomyces broussonetiae TaxID=2686304 RepID=A0ABV5EKA2_9ACTN
MRDIGILRANWDCWSDCNLRCEFCFRSMAVPVDEREAQRLVRALAFSGVDHLTLTGGDPSLRKDLEQIVDAGHRHGMAVEVLTNAQHQPARVLRALAKADLVGVSLDGADQTTHDAFRGKRGNFRRVMELMDFLDGEGVPYVVRTVISRENSGETAEIARLISGRRQLLRWSVQQFTPVGLGYRNRERYAITDASFLAACRTAREAFSSASADFTTLSDAGKVRLYLFADSSGNLFCRSSREGSETLPTIGNILTTHLATLAERVQIDPSRHARRYATWIPENR